VLSAQRNNPQQTKMPAIKPINAHARMIITVISSKQFLCPYLIRQIVTQMADIRRRRVLIDFTVR